MVVVFQILKLHDVWLWSYSTAKYGKFKLVQVNIFVIGYCKTDHNVTLGQLHFIGPANSHTHALSMHCCITGLS